MEPRGYAMAADRQRFAPALARLEEISRTLGERDYRQQDQHGRVEDRIREELRDSRAKTIRGRPRP